MKNFLIAAAVLLSATVAAQTKKPLPAKKPVAATASIFKNSTDSLSYAIGLEGASFYKSQGAKSLNTLLIKKGFDDAFANKKPLLTPEECNMTIQTKMQEFMSNKASVVKEESQKFLDSNKKRSGVITLPSGLQYEIIKEGTGSKPKITDTVKAHYAGTTIDGTEFDNSYKRGQPLEIPVGGVIQGWVEALQLMPVGSKWKLFIPSDLGYGDRGAGEAIPGGAALIFDIELIDIVKK
ncbi:MAG: FKBP-type peptidyl-prolyl cis-trans isomerase [Ginsengibacter sp.]